MRAALFSLLACALIAALMTAFAISTTGGGC